MRQGKMNKENTDAAKVEERPACMTRSRAKALGVSTGIPPTSRPSFKQDKKRVIKENLKRAASYENKASLTAVASLKHKRRAVLKEVTNIHSETSRLNCAIANEDQSSKQAEKCPAKKCAVVADICVDSQMLEEDTKAKLAEELSKIRMVETEEHISPTADDRKQGMLSVMAEGAMEEENKISVTIQASSGLGIIDIDAKFKDPLYCSLYAPDIYKNAQAAELDQRPSFYYMESLQRDITSAMRGILIDWLVEVSEEYKLVPDTLYLTVYLIDRFLSENYIEKQRLQLLGVGCMLIASKFQEICAPRVEEFCFITDNTYTRAEVLKMEIQVLKILCFQLSFPTTKTFLRRFIQAAQASSKIPCIELELLSNYLAELTLIEYNFLKFRPSCIAASAVFLARWTLCQSEHPWNATLEHYTNYKASELKTTVLALEDLQLNTNACSLTAIREKYRQHKFMRVATLISPQRVLVLFER